MRYTIFLVPKIYPGVIDVTTLARDYGVERDRLRQVVSAVVRSVWASAQEWTVAWRIGTAQLKAVVAGLLTAGEEEEEERENTNIPPSVHTAANQLASSVTKMVCNICFVVVFMDVIVFWLYVQLSSLTIQLG